MTYDSIRKMPTCVTPQMFSERPVAVHESCTRAYQILAKVKALLDAGTAPAVIRELIDMMETELPEAKGDHGRDGA